MKTILKWTLIGLTTVAVLSAAAIFAAVRGYNSRAIAELENRYRQSGLIPASARDLMISTTQHWSFNGDGYTRLSFQCSESDFNNLMQKCSITNALAILDEPSLNTIRSGFMRTRELTTVMPTLTDTYYYRGDRLAPKPWYYYGQLIVLDPRLHRFWLFQIVT